MVAAHVLITLLWVVRLCLASLANHDRAAEEAAVSLGARPLTVIWRVTLPAMRGHRRRCAVRVHRLVREPRNDVVPTAPGMTTLPIAVLQHLQYHIDPLVAAVAVVQVVLVGAALIVLDQKVDIAQVAV